MSPERDHVRRPPDIPPDEEDLQAEQAGPGTAIPLPSDIEVPEADALEQAAPPGAPPWVASRTSDIEAPEADALEQAAEVPTDADDEYEHMIDADEEDIADADERP